MAKDSDKQAVLAKRKVELAHAVNHSFSDSIIAKRVEKLRSAALKLLKKESHRSLYDSQDNSELNKKWDSLTHPEIIEIANKWPDNPSIRDLQRILDEN